MPTESPSINSTRVLRANRLNRVETAKLRTELYVLDKSKLREIRLANQDIRLINLTLDYIQSSSGHSPEGLPPDYVEKKTERDTGPMFMYGERIRSRKFGKKFRRVQSAQVPKTAFISEEHEVDEQGPDEGIVPEVVVAKRKSRTAGHGKHRPKSSPAKTISSLLSDFDTETLVSVHKDLDEYGDEEVGKNEGEGRGNRQRSRKMPIVTLNTKSRDNESEQVTELKGAVRPRSAMRPDPETHEMRQKVKEARAQLLSSKKKKQEPKEAWTTTSASMFKRQQEILEFKKNMNVERKQTVNAKLQQFMDLYPLKKY